MIEPGKAEFCKNKAETTACFLCPNLCILKEGQTGKCLSRKREDGMMKLTSYAQVVSAGFDPIEKKPLYHVTPGKRIFSVGSFGCNLTCRFCQNHNISQRVQPSNTVMPEQLLELALKDSRSVGVAFTYNEPGIWYEYIIDSAPLLKKHNQLVVLVTNAYLSDEPWRALCSVADAMNIDLKSFDSHFYNNICSGKLEIVKKNIKTAIELGVHVELTNLLITGLNDNISQFELMLDWISAISKDIPLHISRYFPRYLEKAPPTDVGRLEDFYKIASSYLNYVYLGNVAGDSDTICPKCGNLWVHRNGYSTTTINTDTCSNCGKVIPFLLNANEKSKEL